MCFSFIKFTRFTILEFWNPYFLQTSRPSNPARDFAFQNSTKDFYIRWNGSEISYSRCHLVIWGDHSSMLLGTFLRSKAKKCNKSRNKIQIISIYVQWTDFCLTLLQSALTKVFCSDGKWESDDARLIQGNSRKLLKLKLPLYQILFQNLWASQRCFKIWFSRNRQFWHDWWSQRIFSINFIFPRFFKTWQVFRFNCVFYICLPRSCCLWKHALHNMNK